MPPGSSFDAMSIKAQARIDGETVELKQTICKPQAQINALYTQRNTLSLVFRLPPETLSIIFIQYARTHLESDREWTGVPDWVNVSYVCCHWRNVALNCPTLWTHIFLTSRSWTDELLSRSKTAPLKVYSRYSTPWEPWREALRLKHLKHVLTHMERIQDLYIEIPDSPGREELLSRFTSPAPLLQSLVVHRGGFHHISSFFNGVAPALRQLRLFSCALPSPIPTLRNLTTLILSCSGQLTMDEFKAILYSSQSIVHLELFDSLSRTTWKQDSHPSEVFRPPHLLRLSIKEISCNVIRLLSWLDIPPQTEVRLDVSSFLPETWTTLRSLIAQRLFISEQNSLTPPSIRTLAVDVNLLRVLFTVKNR